MTSAGVEAANAHVDGPAPEPDTEAMWRSARLTHASVVAAVYVDDRAALGAVPLAAGNIVVLYARVRRMDESDSFFCICVLLATS